MMVMKAFLYMAAALCGYAAASINPAILLSRTIYRQDIRACGSGNPGFTNFKRSFGGRWAWVVLTADLCKAAVPVCFFAWLFSRSTLSFQLGAAYTGMFCMLGHTYPLWYGFRGGKGFLVCLATMYVIDWRVGLIATGIMLLLLLTTKYMSLSTTLSMLLCPILLLLFGASPPVCLMAAFCAVLMAIRHRENFRRLVARCEPEFSFSLK